MRPSGSHNTSIRATSLTAGPITVKSRRSTAPTLPYSTSPTCSAKSTEAVGLPASRRIAAEPVEPGHRLDGGVERPAAGRAALGFLEREAGEHAVAEEFEHLAAACAQRRDQGLEYLVEHFDQDQARHRVGDRGKAADIGVAQHGADALDRTALDRTGMHPPPGIAPR